MFKNEKATLSFQKTKNNKVNENYFKNKLLDETLTIEETQALKELELEKPISLEKVKKNYKKLVKIFHPDVNANNMTAKGAKYEGYPIKMVSIVRSFHGRTDRPAQISHSCKPGYDKNLASFKNRDNLILVPANDIESLREVFQRSVNEK